MATVALKLDSNDMFQWGMKRLMSSCFTARPSKAVLCIIQNVAVYYCCLGVKRCGQSFSQAQRNMKASESLEAFVVPGFLMWMDDHDYRLPGWITMEMMGKSTLNGTTKFYDGELKALWARFTEIQRTIKGSHNGIYDSLVVGGQLPSGNQVEDIALQLNQKLWEQESCSRKQVKIADVRGVPSVEEMIAADGNEDGTTTELLPMPDDYVNNLFLTFALFGRPSDSEDSDLALTPNSGPKNKKRRTSDGMKLEEGSGGDGDADCDDEGGGDGVKADLAKLSRRAVKMMVGPGESKSRADSRKNSPKGVAAGAGQAAGAVQEARREMIDLLKNLPKDATQVELAVAVVSISTVLENIAKADALKRVCQEKKDRILNLQGELNMLIQLGMEDEAHQVKQKFLTAFRTPASPPAPAASVAESTAAAAPAPAAPVAEPSAAATPAPAAPVVESAGVGTPAPAAPVAEPAAAVAPAPAAPVAEPPAAAAPAPAAPVVESAGVGTPALTAPLAAPATAGTPALAALAAEPAAMETPLIDVSGSSDPLPDGTGGGGARVLQFIDCNVAAGSGWEGKIVSI